MIRNNSRPAFLSLPSKPATPEDLETAADLADTR